MIGLIDSQGNYYEADKNITGAEEVPLRPSANHAWQNGGWVYVESQTSTLKTEKIAQIDAAYNAAIQQDISYMGTTFQADEDSQSILTKTLVTLNGAGSAPADWAWKDANNNMVPMTLAETNGLAMAMLARGWPEFQLRDARKKAVAAATTGAAVAAVTW